MCTWGPSMARGFASNASGCISETIHESLPRCVIDAVAFPVYHRQQNPQAFCQEAVIWKRLSHPNIVPLLGITLAPPQLVSEWIPGGDLLHYIKAHPDVDRLELVGAHPIVLLPRLPPPPAL